MKWEDFICIWCCLLCKGEPELIAFCKIPLTEGKKMRPITLTKEACSCIHASEWIDCTGHTKISFLFSGFLNEN
jgi:hypothetical protein